ncbi:MAG: sigma-70 family RNA polymerase sigma factor, partial [Bacteroides sp.]|nr:sigma-70 family RNA polymerase sigma factor [Bacteroides sp.]
DKMLANLSDEDVDDALAGETEEQLRRLEAALMKLDAEERTLITLHYMEEKPLKEVAFVLGMTEGNAKVKLHRIRKKLCVLIKQKNYE